MDGEPFAPLRDSGGAPLGATFSANGQLTLGGVDGTCGFSGAIAEVLLFNAALVASDAATVARYLAQRWKLPRLAPGAASAALAGGAAATAAGGGGGEAAARGAGGSGKTIIIVKADDTKMLDWMPPPGVGSTSAIESWKKQTANAKNKIASFPEGGAPLRACVVLCFCNYRRCCRSFLSLPISLSTPYPLPFPSFPFSFPPPTGSLNLSEMRWGSCARRSSRWCVRKMRVVR